MSRPYKIKRTKYTGPIKPRRHPLVLALIILAAIGLGYLGFVSYQPIYNAIMNRGEASPPAPLPPESPQASAAPPEEESPVPAPEPLPPAQLQAVYLPPALMNNPAALERFLEEVENSSLNAVMVDIKDQSGQVLFATQNQQAMDWQAVSAQALDLSAFARRLEERGLFLVARMSAFRDETAARGDGKLAINYRAYGTLWLDNFQNQGGKPWLNPYSSGARQYLLDLALEAADCGAVLVVLDHVCFPPNSLTGDAYFGEAPGRSRAEALTAFAQEAQGALAQKGARGAIYLTGSALADEPNPTVYGGPAADIAAEHILLGALPYQFSDGYSTQKLTLRRPLEDPAATVKEVAALAQRELKERSVIPLIQGGAEPQGMVYTAQQIAAQIQALNALGLEEFILYCTDYTAYLLP